MGMFDRVICNCPNCGEEVEFQSKVGDCLLNRFTLDRVPMNIAMDINGSSVTCDNCGEFCSINTIGDISEVRMEVR